MACSGTVTPCRGAVIWTRLRCWVHWCARAPAATMGTCPSVLMWWTTLSQLRERTYGDKQRWVKSLDTVLLP